MSGCKLDHQQYRHVIDDLNDMFWGFFPSLVLRVQQWAVTFGKEIAAMSARYSGAKLLQKVRAHTLCIKIHTHFYKDSYVDVKTAR